MKLTDTEKMNIHKTVHSWKALGLDISYCRVNRSTTPKEQYRLMIKFEGKLMTVFQFAKRFPYAVNPAN